MADFAGTIRTLEEQRKELLEQVAAIDRAIAALKGTDRVGLGRSVAPVVGAAPRAPKPMAPKRRYRLSEEHKRRMVEGRRRALEARSAAATASDSAAPAIAGWRGDQPSRLVRRGAEAPGSEPGFDHPHGV